jgi:hypothetical protein
VKKNRKDAMLHLRVEQSELVRWRSAAKSEGLNLSRYIRKQLNDYASEVLYVYDPSTSDFQPYPWKEEAYPYEVRQVEGCSWWDSFLSWLGFTLKEKK